MKGLFVRIVYVIVALAVCAAGNIAAQMESFDGLSVNLGNLFRISSAKTRSISPESFSGEPGRGGMATDGTGRNAARDLGQKWKVSPSVHIQAKQG